MRTTTCSPRTKCPRMRKETAESANGDSGGGGAVGGGDCAGGVDDGDAEAGGGNSAALDAVPTGRDGRLHSVSTVTSGRQSDASSHDLSVPAMVSIIRGSHASGTGHPKRLTVHE